LAVAFPGEAARYVPLGGEMVFLGYEGAADDTILRPRFLALRPLTRDYSVSAGLGDARTDGTPALGAIPTLKWLRGWQVVDPHTLSPQSSAEPEGGRTVAVYDAFTLRPLNVLDERLVREGQGTWVRDGG
jgi:hypothetical protein